MNKDYLHSVSIFLDTRREKSNRKFPVKLRVYSKIHNKAKLYNTNKDLTEKEFETIWINSENISLRGDNRRTRLWLINYETRANDEAEKLSPFSFDKFERQFFRKSSDSNNVYYHYNNMINTNIKKGKIGSSESFRYSLKSITSFNIYRTNKESARFSFNKIDVDWLEAYEKFMLDKGKSVTSIGIYLRALRIIFNNAIEHNDISKELYPFGKKKYSIPTSNKVKKALNSNDLKILFDSVPKTPEQEKSKDFWFFSYACSGMNLKDILLLKYSDLIGGKFSYYRAKTFSKSKIKNKIEIHLNSYAKGIIKKYGTDNLDSFIFPFIQKSDSEEIRYKKIKNFTRFINQHLKNLAKDIDLTEDLSLYWARHSFATNSIRKGATMEFISEALNHSDLRVTKNYFAGFEDETKKEFANKLMDF